MPGIRLNAPSKGVVITCSTTVGEAVAQVYWMLSCCCCWLGKNCTDRKGDRAKPIIARVAKLMLVEKLEYKAIT